MLKIIKLNKVYSRFKQESFRTSSLINNAKNAGSGMPNIFNVLADGVWKETVIEERFDPDGTILSLSFLKK